MDRRECLIIVAAGVIGRTQPSFILIMLGDQPPGAGYGAVQKQLRVFMGHWLWAQVEAG